VSRKLTIATTEHKYERAPGICGLDETARAAEIVQPDGVRILRADPLEHYGAISGVRITWVEGDS
jgi:hypothetical protein